MKVLILTKDIKNPMILPFKFKANYDIDLHVFRCYHGYIISHVTRPLNFSRILKDFVRLHKRVTNSSLVVNILVNLK